RTVEQAGRELGLETVLAILQILDQTLARLRFSTQARTLAELALVRITRLADLQAVADLIAEVRAGGPLAPAERTAPVAAPATARPPRPAMSEVDEAPKKKPDRDDPVALTDSAPHADSDA